MRYRARYSTDWIAIIPEQRVRIDAERTWELEADESAISTFAAAVGSAGDRITPTMLHLAFGNCVGLYRAANGITLEVHSGKWSEADFDRMLADIVATCASLPLLASADAGALPYERVETDDELSAYHAFIYLRHVLGETAPEGDLLRPALATIVRDPHRRIEVERATVPLQRARGVDEQTVVSLARNGGLERAQGANARLPLSRMLGGFLPREIDEPRIVRDVDTLENRFVLSFLRNAQRVSRRFATTSRIPSANRCDRECSLMPRGWMRSSMKRCSTRSGARWESLPRFHSPRRCCRVVAATCYGARLMRANATA
jgi:hypothetical protein